MLDFLLWSHILLWLCVCVCAHVPVCFLSLFSPHCSDLIISIVLSFSWLILTSVLSIQLLIPFIEVFLKNYYFRASLVVWWLRICLPMQGTRVRALVWEDPTCRRATKPVRHNSWACALEPASHNYWVQVLQPLKPAYLEPMLRNKRSHRNEKPAHHNRVAPAHRN